MTTYIPSLTFPTAAFEKPAVAVLLPLLSGMAVGAVTGNSKQVYGRLRQPPGHPPGWVFGPVWTILYAGMGYAAYRAWTAGTTSLSLEKLSLAKVRDTFGRGRGWDFGLIGGC